MRINQSELRAEFDVDNTIIMDVLPGELGEITINYYGESKQKNIHHEHVSLLKSYRERGYHVTVQSANGFAHALEVVTVLGLEEYVDVIQTKSTKVIDDLPNCGYGERVYIPYVNHFTNSQNVMAYETTEEQIENWYLQGKE